MQSEHRWETGVYYDIEVGQFVTFDVSDDEVVEDSLLADWSVHTFDHDEFDEALENDEFVQVDPFVIDNPESVLEDVLSAFNSDPDDPSVDWSDIEVTFASKYVDFAVKAVVGEHEPTVLDD